ncbi:hypothetical protein OS189_11780 [Sulfitobacter sp. F26169L]|uniref:hypothetical protein n=1 Tax=Sulfitobacter sp. F26169L TaxID=2996015 RepID=UPI002260F2C0|nr:hypothetical protein [Sulfitobacter sp. F26169L]MCX7567022.1 hypothetical protein [Sulfitobacter sp. F26169L]
MQTVYPENVLAGAALTERLTSTKLFPCPVGDKKPPKGAATQFIVKMLPSGESTWESNGKYSRETLTHWEVRGNRLCLEDPNRRFYEERRRKQGKKIRKREKYDNCGVVAINGDLITIYAPKRSYAPQRALTGRIRPL